MPEPHVPIYDLDKELSLTSLPITGQFPEWLAGTLIRNGPAKFNFGAQSIAHWFDGLAMLHAFTFERGRVSYCNRFIRSTAYENAQKGTLNFMGFMQDPCHSVFKRVFSHYFPKLTPSIIQNANVNVMKMAQEYVALTETPLPVRFSPKNLETLGNLKFADALLKENCFESAHPHHDGSNKMCVSFQIAFESKCHYTFYNLADRLPAKREPFFKMTVDQAAYMHSFALTPKYVILVEYPLLVNPLDLIVKNGGFIQNFVWKPERNTRFHLIDRTEGRLLHTFEYEPFFCFHHVNAYEDHDLVIVDMITYPDPAIVYGAPPANQARALKRFELNLTTRTLTPRTILESSIELPRIAYHQFNGQPYQFVYGAGFEYSADPLHAMPIIKIDVRSGTHWSWSQPGCLAGEPVFVPLPDATKEEDGILLTVVLDTRKQNSFLLILNARNLAEIARAEVPQLIPYGLHGMFFDSL